VSAKRQPYILPGGGHHRHAHRLAASAHLSGFPASELRNSISWTAERLTLAEFLACSGSIVDELTAACDAGGPCGCSTPERRKALVLNKVAPQCRRSCAPGCGDRLFACLVDYHTEQRGITSTSHGRALRANGAESPECGQLTWRILHRGPPRAIRPRLPAGPAVRN
jgi:hypothetical protein